jgi:hypothetical protein
MYIVGNIPEMKMEIKVFASDVEFLRKGFLV